MAISLIYLALNCLIIWRVGQSLYTCGIHYLLVLFDSETAHGLNKVLLTGYYLLNLGLIVFTMAKWPGIDTTQQLIEALLVRSGVIFMLLGAIHAINVLWLALYSHYKKYKQLNH
jgi:hypothetical protein